MKTQPQRLQQDDNQVEAAKSEQYKNISVSTPALYVACCRNETVHKTVKEYYGLLVDPRKE